MVRIALGLGVREFAALAGVSPDTISRLEGGEVLRKSTVDRIVLALGYAGIEILDATGETGASVRLANRVERITEQPTAGDNEVATRQ